MPVRVASYVTRSIYCMRFLIKNQTNFFCFFMPFSPLNIAFDLDIFHLLKMQVQHSGLMYLVQFNHFNPSRGPCAYSFVVVVIIFSYKTNCPSVDTNEWNWRWKEKEKNKSLSKSVGHMLWNIRMNWTLDCCVHGGTEKSHQDEFNSLA